MRKANKELIEELQQHLLKIKVDNNLDFEDFERIVCTAANNVSKDFNER